MIKIGNQKYIGRNVLNKKYKRSSIFVVYSLFIWIFFNFKNVNFYNVCDPSIFDRAYI